MQVSSPSGVLIKVLDLPVGESSIYPRRRVVEFYDTRYDFTAHGQFISRYYAEQLIEDNWGRGLDLEGGVPDWSVSAPSMRAVVAWLTKGN